MSVPIVWIQNTILTSKDFLVILRKFGMENRQLLK